VRDVRLKNIEVVADAYNTVSLLGGYDADHTIEGVTFENFNMGDKKVTGADDINLFSRHADNIKFL
jgi:DNA/RNA-binding domain of Phe-tRNA-synthetase-like protein